MAKRAQVSISSSGLVTRTAPFYLEDDQRLLSLEGRLGGGQKICRVAEAFEQRTDDAHVLSSNEVLHEIAGFQHGLVADRDGRGQADSAGRRQAVEVKQHHPALADQRDRTCRHRSSQKQPVGRDPFLVVDEAEAVWSEQRDVELPAARDDRLLELQSLLADLLETGAEHHDVPHAFAAAVLDDLRGRVRARHHVSAIDFTWDVVQRGMAAAPELLRMARVHEVDGAFVAEAREIGDHGLRPGRGLRRTDQRDRTRHQQRAQAGHRRKYQAGAPISLGVRR